MGNFVRVQKYQLNFIANNDETMILRHDLGNELIIR